MKLLLSLALPLLLLASEVYAAANCAHSHSWQCQGHLSNSAGQSQSGSGISSTGNTPNSGTTNPHLGSNGQSVPMLSLVPATTIATPPTPVTLTPPKATPPKAPPIVNPVKVPNQVVTPTPTPTLTGQGLRPTPQITPIKAPPIVGYGKVPNQQPIIAPPIVNPYKAPPLAVVPVQTPSFTGQGKVPSPQVTGTQAPPITGIGAVPQQQVTPVLAPPIIVGNQAPPIVVNPVKTPVLTGQGKEPLQQVTAIQSPPLTGYGRIPDRPVINVPSLVPPVKPSAQPYLIPPKIPTGSPVTPPVKVVQVPPRLPNKIPQITTEVTQPSVTTQPPSTTQPLVTTQPSTTTHWIVNSHTASLITQQQVSAGLLNNKGVWPAIHNQAVALYTSEHASDKVYKDIIPMEKAGFFLTVVGMKEPHFAKRKMALPEVEGGDFVFFFDYASTAIFKDQADQIDQIVERYQSTGQRVNVMGETDGFGSYEYNAQLAIHRSNIIINQLIAKGIPSEAIELKVWIRCCRIEEPTLAAIAATEDQRITWVSFE